MKIVNIPIIHAKDSIANIRAKHVLNQKKKITQYQWRCCSKVNLKGIGHIYAWQKWASPSWLISYEC